MSWPIIFRIVAMMPLGVWIGLKLFQGLPTYAIQILIGIFVLLSLVTGYFKSAQRGEFPLWAFVPLGFITGALNMVVGVISPILGVLIMRKDLSKEAMVGTLGFFGFIGNLLKLIGFSLIGFSFVEFGPLILCMIPAAIVGTRFGKSVLTRLDERAFMVAFQAMLLALALKLIFIDGLGLI